MEGYILMNTTEMLEICVQNATPQTFANGLFLGLGVFILFFLYVGFIIKLSEVKRMQKYIRETRQLDKYEDWSRNRKTY